MDALAETCEDLEQGLPEIPLIDVGSAGPAVLVAREPGRAEALITAGRRQFGGPVIDLLDWYSRRWARGTGGTYLGELESLSAAGLPSGLWFMNHCFEWGCSTAAAADPISPGARLLRTLDWPFHGLGRQVVVARQVGPAGIAYNITWPGFIGVITAMAPGRFCAAINQAPVLRRGPAGVAYPWLLDWVAGRVKTFRGRRMPPALLLRRVVDHCPDFAEARRMLSEVPLALPAFFTLAGTDAREACVIERLEEQAFVHEDPAAVANHWLTPGLRGKSRGLDSPERLQRMRAHCATPPADGFDWLSGSILNRETRLAVVANAASGRLLVRGYEVDGPATRVFDLQGHA